MKLSCGDDAWNITSPWSPIQVDSVPLSFRYYLFFFFFFLIFPLKNQISAYVCFKNAHKHWR